ncbi:MAG TPA: transglutaminase family protein, partial [Candidatus Acidoferrales bacterium]|nr:transglutaminase family protein [Candidatus Acidoferrales bacterium]
MPIRIALHHKTDYRYDRLVALSPQIVRLRPAPYCRTPIAAYSLKIEPAGHFINWQQDPQNNYLARLVFPELVRHFSVEVGLVAEMTVINPFDFFLEAYAEKIPFQYEAWQAQELAPYLTLQPAGPQLRKFLETIGRSEHGLVQPGSPEASMDFLVGINQRLQSLVRYVIRMEPGIQTCEETLTLASGSCRDSAWLLVQILRRLGLAARFVSGYLIQLKPDVKPLDGPEGPGQDVTDLHAWAEVYLPGAGWVGLDPTSGLLAAEGHIPLAATPEPASAAPITGGVGPCQVEFVHEMSVSRIHEDPRVTLPYTDGQWERIEALGRHVDAQIQSGDIRLTMGGEPTFVSVDNMDGEEWNFTAFGAQKRQLAGRLIERLRARFAPGALLHFGLGKWYPGEPLPRWALTAYWRKDGVAMWHDHGLVANEAAPDEAEACFGPQHAQNFAETLARRLGVDPAYTIAAFEDPEFYLQKERQLPVNVDPADNRQEDAAERERLRQVFLRGLNTPTGVVLPLQRGDGARGPEWQSGLWMLRGQHLLLVAGDSPVGLRLPLASLPWVAPDEAPKIREVDPMATRGPLPVPVRRTPPEPVLPGGLAQSGQAKRERDRQPALGESAPWVVRRALCVEPRDGRLHIFMPPVEAVEDYLDLVTAIEDTAAHLGAPVSIEGYAPPYDPRIDQIKVTPDPGVIEVNVHPAHNWAELVDNTTAFYEEARLARLGTEKFMLDGKHSGTGGGNHFVMGAATPADSPFLRRPDLLRSMIG